MVWWVCWLVLAVASSPPSPTDWYNTVLIGFHSSSLGRVSPLDLELANFTNAVSLREQAGLKQVATYRSCVPVEDVQLLLQPLANAQHGFTLFVLNLGAISPQAVYCDQGKLDTWVVGERFAWIDASSASAEQPPTGSWTSVQLKAKELLHLPDCHGAKRCGLEFLSTWRVRLEHLASNSKQSMSLEEAQDVVLAAEMDLALETASSVPPNKFLQELRTSIHRFVSDVLLVSNVQQQQTRTWNQALVQINLIRGPHARERHAFPDNLDWWWQRELDRLDSKRLFVASVRHVELAKDSTMSSALALARRSGTGYLNPQSFREFVGLGQGDALFSQSVVELNVFWLYGTVGLGVDGDECIEGLALAVENDENGSENATQRAVGAVARLIWWASFGVLPKLNPAWGDRNGLSTLFVDAFHRQTLLGMLHLVEEEEGPKRGAAARRDLMHWRTEVMMLAKQHNWEDAIQAASRRLPSSRHSASFTTTTTTTSHDQATLATWWRSLRYQAKEMWWF
ncbi:hypothetical protein BASA81_000260 [Batrachochytrium salamandrivorans]|nr:hypothetical protein BASA81_000260 [Batrachochytrium salamandrivorans]